MRPWSDFPTRRIASGTTFSRIHRTDLHPAWFNTDGTWRFDPLPTHRTLFGTCYLGLTDLASYIEVFGRLRAVPQRTIEDRALSRLHPVRDLEVADLTDRSVLGEYGITAAHSAGDDYGPSQELATALFEAGIDGIRYRVRHDPAMTLEGIALFGDPGEGRERFTEEKASAIPPDLIQAGRDQFKIEVIPSAALP